MIAFEAGDVIWVPVPFVERAQVVNRPALVVSRHPLGNARDLLWVLMITNAARPSWAGDVEIPDHMGVGLSIPSKIRSEKISTVEAKDAERIGRLDAPTLAKIMRLLAHHLPDQTKL